MPLVVERCDMFPPPRAERAWGEGRADGRQRSLARSDGTLKL